MKYRKKVTAIEAYQYVGNLEEEIDKKNVPDWILEANEDERFYFSTLGNFFVRGIDELTEVNINDYLISYGGLIYVTKKEKFEEVYEKVSG